MSEWFHVGQKVVCLDADLDDGLLTYHSPLVEGGIYVVEAVCLGSGFYHGEWVEGVGLVLVGVNNPSSSDQREFNAARFRPLRERKADIAIFTRMLTPNKERVDA